jgi:hypothetical protein
MANTASEMIGTGCSNISEVNSLPVILLKYGINKTPTSKQVQQKEK